MKKQVLWFVSALVVAAALAAVVHAQAFEALTVNIPYAFTVSGQQLPAGPYVIDRIGITGTILRVRSEDGKNGVQADVLTRIVGPAKAEDEARVVLDKYEDKYSLSEVFFPGEDGFLLAGAKNTPHKHEVVKAKTKKA